jgi:hypothetical protein
MYINQTKRNIAAIYLLVIAEVGTKVLPNAQIIDTTKMITNWETGKKNLS